MKPKSLKENEEVIIIRKEYDPYDKRPMKQQTNYVAVFPDCEDRPGYMMCLAMWVNGNGEVVFPEGHGSMSRSYLWKTKKVHDMELKKKLVNAVQALWDSYNEDPKVSLVLREKMYFGRRC